MKKVSKNVVEFPLAKGEPVLDRLARQGAQQILMKALNREVVAFLERGRYKRNENFKGYRNGSGKLRKVAVGLGHVELRAPRVSDVPEEVGEFRSRILDRYQRMSKTTRDLLLQLYLEGLSSGDFEPVFRHLLGETAPLSSTSIIQMKEEWQGEYDAWQKRPLEKCYAYSWADGIYLAAGPKDDTTAMLVVVGVNEHGEKELLAIREGHRESKESWSEVLRDLKARGVEVLGLLAGDGHLGIWSALHEVFPETKEQGCWNHKAMNVVDKLPKRLQEEAQMELRNIWRAPTREECAARAQTFAKKLRLMKQESAAESLLRNFDRMTTFYDFPKEHWVHLRTTNVIESVFHGVRLRTNVTKRMKSARTALYLVFKVIQRLSQRWRTINKPVLVKLILEGAVFKNGIQVVQEEVKQAA